MSDITKVDFDITAYFAGKVMVKMEAIDKTTMISVNGDKSDNCGRIQGPKRDTGPT